MSLFRTHTIHHHRNIPPLRFVAKTICPIQSPPIELSTWKNPRFRAEEKYMYRQHACGKYTNFYMIPHNKRKKINLKNYLISHITEMKTFNTWK